MDKQKYYGDVEWMNQMNRFTFENLWMMFSSNTYNIIPCYLCMYDVCIGCSVRNESITKNRDIEVSHSSLNTLYTRISKNKLIYSIYDDI